MVRACAAHAQQWPGLDAGVVPARNLCIACPVLPGFLLPARAPWCLKSAFNFPHLCGERCVGTHCIPALLGIVSYCASWLGVVCGTSFLGPTSGTFLLHFEFASIDVFIGFACLLVRMGMV